MLEYVDPLKQRGDMLDEDPNIVSCKSLSRHHGYRAKCVCVGLRVGAVRACTGINNRCVSSDVDVDSLPQPPNLLCPLTIS